MAFEKYIEQLKTNQEEIEESIETINEELILFDKLANEEQSDDPKHYYNEDYIIALLVANTNIDFYTVKHAINSSKNLFEKTNYKNLAIMLNAVYNVLHTISYDELMDILLNNKKIEGNSTLKIQLFIVKKIANYSSDISSFIKLFDLDIINVTDCMQTIINMMSFERILKAYNVNIKISKKILGSGSNHNKHKEVLRKLHQIDSAIDTIKPAYKKIIEHRHDLAKKDSATKRKYRKTSSAYTTVIKWLTKNKDSKCIYDIPNELSKIDEDLQLEILREICKLNQKYYDNLEKEYNKLSKSNKKKTILIFKKYGIDISEDDINSDIDENNMTELLTMLKKMNATDRLIIDIINGVPRASIEEIYELFQSGTISNTFAINNLGLILDRYPILINNINIAKSSNFSNSSIMDIEETLLQDSDKFKGNLDTLKEYKLLDSKKIALHPNILLAEDLDTRIDLVLELGYESLLSDDLGLLEADPIAFKRLIALRRLNIKIDDPNQLYSILTNNKFVVKDDDLDSYIYVETIHQEELDDLSKDDFLTILNDFKNTNRTYSFDGIIISMNKVEKNINNINNDILTATEQIESIISNSYLDDTEYSKVINCLTAKNKQFKKS